MSQISMREMKDFPRGGGSLGFGKAQSPACAHGTPHPRVDLTHALHSLSRTTPSRPWLMTNSNRPFPSSPGPLYQNEVRCSTLDMEMIFHSHANKTHFHKKS